MTACRTILAIDHDPKACEVYRANVPGAEVRCGNLAEMIDTLPSADVVLGGPPCQPYSSAGKGLGARDERDCVPDYCAAIERVRPRMFLMEEVDSFATDAKFQPVLHRTVRRLEDAGYVVEMRVLDAVHFGVPQFRKRAWFWGIRRDVWEAGVRHRWPSPSHAWPWPEPGMFGGELLPAVTVGMALGLDGYYDAQNEKSHGDEPMGTLQGNAQAKGGGAGHYALRRARGASVDRRDHPASEPSPSLTDGSGGSGGILRIVGGGTNPRFAGDARTERDITDEPSTTLPTDAGNAVPEIHEYRWSDEMLEKHPPASPASPASPAPTVQAKWFKGGAEGLVRIEGASGWSGQRILEEAAPSLTVQSGTNQELVKTKQKRSARPITDPAPTLAGDSRHELRVRRLTPDECARLQSMPDGFVWPESVKKTHRYRIIGNGWASLMAKRLSEAFKRADPVSETVIDLFCGGGCGAVGWHGRAWEYVPSVACSVSSVSPW